MRAVFFCLEGADKKFKDWESFELHMLDVMIKNGVSEMEYKEHCFSYAGSGFHLTCSRTYKSVYENRQIETKLKKP